MSPNRRAAQRPAPSKPVSHPVTHHLLARCQAWGLHHPIHAAAALLGEDDLHCLQTKRSTLTTLLKNQITNHYTDHPGKRRVGIKNAVNAGVARDSSFTQKCGDRVTALRSEEEVVNSGACQEVAQVVRSGSRH